MKVDIDELLHKLYEAQEDWAKSPEEQKLDKQTLYCGMLIGFVLELFTQLNHKALEIVMKHPQFDYPREVTALWECAEKLEQILIEKREAKEKEQANKTTPEFKRPL